MDENDKNLQVSQEERTAEEEAQKEVEDEELRGKIASDLGIDADDEENKDLLEKLLQREKDHRTKLSGAIKQKISWREKAHKTSEKPPDNSGKGKSQDKGEQPDVDKLIEQRMNERFEKIDLDSLEMPDDIKQEVKDLSKVKGVSIREAAKNPYIQSRLAEYERQKRIDNASPGSKGKGSSAQFDPSKPLDPKNYNMNTEEGIKSWKRDKEARDRWRQENH